MSMSGKELRDVISTLGMSQAEFAKLVDVSVGAVAQWLSEVRAIPGPVRSYVSLFMRLPEAIREAELRRLRKGNLTMRNGMYLIQFAGSHGHGLATLTFHDGAVYGFDEAGGKYDGTYEPAGDGMELVSVKVLMPAGQSSVVGGIVQPFDWILECKALIPAREAEGSVVVNTNVGMSLNAAFRRMRDLPAAA